MIKDSFVRYELPTKKTFMFNKTILALTVFNLISLTNTSALSTRTTVDAEADNKAITPVWEQRAQISPYDNIFRSICESEGNDWRLFCAMAYHESRFKSDVTSHCGARGIMQIMPRVATQFDVTTEELYDVESNIYVANRLMTLIEDMLSLPSSTPEKERMQIALAAYNCGVGRIADARRLAKYFGESTNSWSSISHYLTKMNEPQYYQLDAVKYGRFKGASQTNAYVKNVVNHYDKYCLVAMR